MKKFIASSLIASGLLISASAMAQDATQITNGQPMGVNECVLLGDTVRINLSKDVTGAYQCDEALSAIRVGTCHLAGSRSAATLNCSVTDNDEAGDPIYNDSSCTSTDDTFDTISYRAFIASSRGGTVSPTSLDGNCEIGTLTGLGHFNP